MKKVVLALSGGMDSSTLLLHLLAKGYDITALSFDYGQKHDIELERALELVEYLRDNNHEVAYQVVELKGLQQLLHSHLVRGGDDVPEGHYEQENMVDTVVPNRNKMFASVLQATALSISIRDNCEVEIAMGIHAGDHAIYPDCRQEFRDADFAAFQVGNYNAEKVAPYTPYLNIDKFGILQDGLKCCTSLGIDFDEVYKRTNTSYKPMDTETSNGCSDYKSASSVERIEAFIKLGRPDPVQYADETGDVSWSTARNHVASVLAEYAG